MTTAAVKTSRKRTATRQQRRGQLIKATIRSIAKNGLSATTVATVSSEAGMSLGIVNLHFQSKDRLLEETLRHIADEYKAAWEKAFRESGDSPADKIRALVAVDFRNSVCQRNKLAVWFAFWGESKSRPTYREICRTRDREYFRVMIDQCRALITEGGYTGLDPESVANGLGAMTSGLWLDLLMSPDHMSPEKACSICMQFLQSLFPRHFQQRPTAPEQP